MLRRTLRPLLTSAATGVLLLAAIGALGSPAAAYGGKTNYQVAFAGTATLPSTGLGFGFWGGATSPEVRHRVAASGIAN